MRSVRWWCPSEPPLENLHAMPRQRACELVGCLAERQLRLFLHVHLLLVLYYGHGILLSGTTVHELVQGRGHSARDHRHGYPPPQNASVGTYVPHTSRSASHTSPTVARARSASFIG